MRLWMSAYRGQDEPAGGSVALLALTAIATSPSRLLLDDAIAEQRPAELTGGCSLRTAGDSLFDVNLTIVRTKFVGHTVGQRRVRLVATWLTAPLPIDDELVLVASRR